jgi:hypothetical protein
MDPSRVQDLPHRRGRDAMSQPNQLTLNTPMTPARIFSRHANHQLSDRHRGWWTPRSAPSAVVPLAGRETAMPPQKRRRGPRRPSTCGNTNLPGQGVPPHGLQLWLGFPHSVQSWLDRDHEEEWAALFTHARIPTPGPPDERDSEMPPASTRTCARRSSGSSFPACSSSTPHADIESRPVRPSTTSYR